MAVSAGANAVISGLVANWDFGNYRSLIAGPITNSQYNSGSEVTPWTVNGTNTDVSSTVGLSAPVPNAKTWKFVKTGTSSQWNGWESGYGGIWTGSSGDYWSTSFWYKTIAPAGLTSFSVGGFAKSDWSSLNYTVIDSSTSIIADGQWHYAYAVTRMNENYTNAIIADGPSWNYSSQSGELYINGLQWNKNSYATNYVPGTYSASQALKDLTQNRTTSTFNLSYPQGGGNSSSITFPYLTSYASTTTMATDSSAILDTNTHSIFFTIRFNSTTSCPNGYSGNWDKIFGYEPPGTDRSPGIWRWPGERTLHWRYDPGNTGCDFGKSSAGTGNQFDLNTWYYVGVTNNNGSTVMYVNGSQVGTGSVAYPKTSGSSAVGLFPYYPQDLATMGLCQIYNRVLTSDEVAINFNALRARYNL